MFIVLTIIKNKLQKQIKNKIIKYGRVSNDLQTKNPRLRDSTKKSFKIYLFFTIKFVIFLNIRHKKNLNMIINKTSI